MRAVAVVGVVSLLAACSDKSVSPRLGSSAQNAMVVVGNAPATGLNAPAIGLNAPATGLNAPTTGLNAPGMGLNAPATGLNAPATGLNGMHAFGPKARALVQDDHVPYYVVTNELTTIVQPRAIPVSDFVGTNCGGKGFTRMDMWGNDVRSWRFARTYRDAQNNITSSDIEIQGSSGAWTKLPRQPVELVFPAKLTSLGATTSPLDAIIRITNKRVSAYQCSMSYRAMTFTVEVSIVRDGQCFDWVNLGPTMVVPAVKSMVPRYNGSTYAGLSPKGDGWAMLVSADPGSALFKALHYSRAVLDFDDATDDDATAWRYRYPTTAASCDPAAPSSGAASCLDGASVVAAYGLVLTNMIPFVIEHADATLNVVAGHPGTVTGKPVFVSVMKDGRTLRLTRFETPTIGSVAVHLAPGYSELHAASPFPYDAAFGAKVSGRTCMGSVRVGLGYNELRYGSMLSDSTNFVEPFRSDAIEVYESVCTETLYRSTIADLSYTGDFVASAMPVAVAQLCIPIEKPPVDNANDPFVFFDPDPPET